MSASAPTTRPKNEPSLNSTSVSLRSVASATVPMLLIAIITITSKRMETTMAATKKYDTV